MGKDRLVIIDGNSLVNRAYFAIQRPMITKDGFYTQGIYGFLSMLQKIRADYAPTHMLVAYDRKAPTFRHLEYDGYKAGRKGMPMELAMEMPVLKDVLDALGIHQYEIDGFEADDIIGTTAKMAEDAGMRSLIITGDRDALQLATDMTSVIINKRGMSEFKLYDDAAMMEEYGFDHQQFIDYKALRGDTSDNIPGVPGIGEKTATQLIQQFGSLEKVITGVDEIKSASVRKKIEEGAMSAMMSKRLATIVTNVPVDYSLEDLRIKPEDRDRLIELYTKLEFRTWLAKLLKSGSKTGSMGEAESVSAKAEPKEGPAAATDSAASAQPNAPRGSWPELIYTDDKASAKDIMKELFEAGSCFADIAGDGNHIARPSIAALELYFGGKCCVMSFSGLAEFLRDSINGSKKPLKISGFNLGRLYYAFEANGIDTSNITTEFDCALAEYVLHPGSRAPEIGSVILSYFHENIEESGGEAQMSFLSGAAPADEYRTVPKKLALLEDLKTVQEKQIEDEKLGTVLYDIELPLQKVLASMEVQGFKLDRQQLKDFGKELTEHIRTLEADIYSLAGEEFNINSPKQLGVILFEKLGLPAGKKTKSGYSTNAEVLEKLAPDYPIVERILEYRTLSKLNSTYVEGLLPLVAEDGKIHAHFQQMITATGRISCTEPNLQNIPVRSELGRSLRKAFTADSGDYLLIGADYSQIELRVLASMSKDPGLIKSFNEGLDIHRDTASKVFNVPFDEVTREQRSNAKAVNFGVIYGMSGFGLATELTISRKEAERYINDYFEKFKDVKIFMDGCKAEARETGSIRTLYGRKRDIPEIKASNFMTRQLGERLAMNTPIQGTAADIIKIAMIKVFDALARECRDSRLILQVHDELIIQASRDEAEKVRELLKKNMESAAQMAVKLDVSMEEGSNWYELK
jgi:DNA polymerase-1